MEKGKIEFDDPSFRPTRKQLEDAVTFLGGTIKPGGALHVNMPKFNAAYRCEEHRKVKWAPEQTNACVPCLKAALEARERDLYEQKGLDGEKIIGLKQALADQEREIGRLKERPMKAYQLAVRLAEKYLKERDDVTRALDAARGMVEQQNLRYNGECFYCVVCLQRWDSHSDVCRVGQLLATLAGPEVGG